MFFFDDGSWEDLDPRGVISLSNHSLFERFTICFLPQRIIFSLKGNVLHDYLKIKIIFSSLLHPVPIGDLMVREFSGVRISSLLNLLEHTVVLVLLFPFWRKERGKNVKQVGKLSSLQKISCIGYHGSFCSMFDVAGLLHLNLIYTWNKSQGHYF